MAAPALSMGAATAAAAVSITERRPSAATYALCPYLSTQPGSESPRSLSQSQSLARSGVSSLQHLSCSLFEAYSPYRWRAAGHNGVGDLRPRKRLSTCFLESDVRNLGGS